MAVLIAVKTDHPVDERELSAERLQRAAHLKNADDRRRCLCAGVALDAALRTVGLRERTVRLARNAHGKPSLADYPQWHVNLSHSGRWAVCVLSSAPVGVDVQQHRPIAALKVAERYFSPEETRELRCLPQQERTAAFFRLWTRKESLLKAVGTGLSGLSTVTAEGYRFREYPLPGYSLCVCGTDLPDCLTVIE